MCSFSGSSWTILWPWQLWQWGVTLIIMIIIIAFIFTVLFKKSYKVLHLKTKTQQQNYLRQYKEEIKDHKKQRCDFKCLIKCKSWNCERWNSNFNRKAVPEWRGPDSTCIVQSYHIYSFYSVFIVFSVHKSGPNVRWTRVWGDCLKVFIWGAAVLAARLLTVAVWVVIIFRRCPHEAIKVSLTPTLMWPCAPVASPPANLGKVTECRGSCALLQHSDWQADTHTHAASSWF